MPVVCLLINLQERVKGPVVRLNRLSLAHADSLDYNRLFDNFF